MKIGGMEQWGAITFRKRYLTNTTDPQLLHSNYRLLAHEISHMWFGDLVTIDWWEFLWLKEGFARYLEFKCLEHIKPTFHFDREFFLDVNFRALIRDTSCSRPVEIPVENNRTLLSIFDAIAYHKSAAVLKMFETASGEELFAQVMREYLTRYQFKATVSDQFFEIFDKRVSHLTGAMQPWFRQAGVPSVFVEKLSPTAYKLTQELFLQPESAVTWPIPIFYYTDDFQRHFVLLTEQSQVIELEQPSAWVKINAGATGYYLTQYDPLHFDYLIDSFYRLSTLDRSEMTLSYIFLWCKCGRNFKELVRLVNSSPADFSHPYLVFLNQIPMRLSSLELLFNPQCKMLVHRPYFLYWGKFGLFPTDPEDEVVAESAPIVYAYLVNISKDPQVSRAVVEAKHAGTLPTNLAALYPIALANSGLPDLLERATANQTFGETICLHSNDVALIKSVLQGHFEYLISRIHEEQPPYDKTPLIQALLGIASDDSARAVTAMNTVLTLASANYIEERLYQQIETTLEALRVNLPAEESQKLDNLPTRQVLSEQAQEIPQFLSFLN